MQVANLMQTSGNVEFYSPAIWTELAKSVMGYIELDPASCEVANQSVGAQRIFTKDDDGLSREWIADTLWMNHPFGIAEKACKPGCTKKICQKRGYHRLHDYSGNAGWINKLVSEYEAGNVKEAVSICFASTSERWFQPLMKYPQCFPFSRVNYLDPEGNVVNGVTKGSVITYFGNNVDKFAEVFGNYGNIKVAYKPASS